MRADYYGSNCLVSSTIDGNGFDGFYDSDGSGTSWAIVNSIFYNCVNAIRALSPLREELRTIRNNLFEKCTNPVDGNVLQIKDRDWRQNIIDPSERTFTNKLKGDYTLADDSADTSEAIQSGIDAQYTFNYWDSYIRGTNPPLSDL